MAKNMQRNSSSFGKRYKLKRGNSLAAQRKQRELCRLYHVLDDETGDGRGEF
ncbi:MAG: hypothetical protein ACOX3A_10895 [bacterium]